MLSTFILGPGIPLNCIPGNPTFNSSPPNPLGLPCSGTTVFPLPGSFPWTAGNRGKHTHRCAQFNNVTLIVGKYIVCKNIELKIYKSKNQCQQVSS